MGFMILRSGFPNSWCSQTCEKRPCFARDLFETNIAVFVKAKIYLVAEANIENHPHPCHLLLAGHSSCFRVPAAFFCCSPLICPVNRRRAGGEPTLPNSVNISSIHPTMHAEHKSTDFCGARKFQREEQLRQFCKHVYHENRLVSASRYIVLWSFYK